jgi:hypothetical protein
MKGEVERLGTRSTQKHVAAPSTLFGYWSDTAQASQSVEISISDGVVCEAEQRGED